MDPLKPLSKDFVYCEKRKMWQTAAHAVLNIFTLIY